MHDAYFKTSDDGKVHLSTAAVFNFIILYDGNEKRTAFIDRLTPSLLKGKFLPSKYGREGFENG